jgi:signal transduction histidine kinase
VPEEIQGKNIFSYIKQEDEELPGKLFQFYKSGKAINREEVVMVTKNRDVRFVQLSIFEMKSVGSFFTTGFAMIFDITEEKMLDRAKTEFVSLASHQLRTPLATTKWLTEMLASGDLGDLTSKQKEYVDKLHTSNQNMVDLVDTLLNILRIEIGTLNIDIKPTNVEELCESILSELAYPIVKKNIQINREFGGHLQNIQSDPKLLRIVIQNLVSNAVKYTPDNGTITIAFVEVGDNKKIVVSDTGLGIPEAQQDKVFTKLFRADNVRKLSSSQGTGLGLYLVKSVMGSLGGNISFESEENKGSIFTITL